MEVLYWITILGNISVVCCIIATLGLLFALIFTTIFVCANYYNGEEEKKALHKRSITSVWVVSIIALIGTIFIPSKEDWYVIYGVGSTIDYLKENPTAQQLPDKYIKVLDKWAEEELTKKEQ